MTDTIVPLSYLVRQRQEACAEVIRRWFSTLAPMPATLPLWAARWTRDDMRFSPAADDPNWNLEIVFTFTGFDPDSSTETHGQPHTVSDDIVTLDDHTILMDNRQGTAPLDVDLSQSVTFRQSRTTTTASKIAVDIGTKVGTTIGGEAEGGSIEAEISANFHVEQDTQEIQAESTDRTESHDIRTTVPVGEALLATISTPNLVTVQGFTVRGAIDGGIRVEYNDGLAAGPWHQLESGPRYAQSGSRKSVQFMSFLDFTTAVAGVNVDFPTVHGPLPGHADIVGQVQALRMVTWAGMVHRTSEQSAGYKFAKVDDSTADRLVSTLRPDQVIGSG